VVLSAKRGRFNKDSCLRVLEGAMGNGLGRLQLFHKGFLQMKGYPFFSVEMSKRKIGVCVFSELKDCGRILYIIFQNFIFTNHNINNESNKRRQNLRFNYECKVGLDWFNTAYLWNNFNCVVLSKFVFVEY